MKSLFTFVGLVLIAMVAVAEGPKPLLALDGVTWTAAETDYIHALQRRGQIKIATNRSAIDRGFHYNILKVFADLAQIDIDIRLVSRRDYFYRADGDLERIKTDPIYAYVPTLIENVDLYLDGITVLPWREKMFSIVKFVPTRQMLVTRKTDRPEQLSDLDGKVAAMVADTTISEHLARLALINGLTFGYLYKQNFNQLDRMVARGLADFTVFNSDRAFTALAHYPNLTIAFAISEPQVMGWAVHKEKRVLKSVLEKYLLYAQDSGILDRVWARSYGVSFSHYLNILTMGETSH
jgi:membrane-bound lytic murein transglycosylase MltF